MTDLIQRALITRIEYLEQKANEAEKRADFFNGELVSISQFLCPEADPLVWAEATATGIMEELKRRGIGGNGKAA